jgi:quinolinate synthase
VVRLPVLAYVGLGSNQGDREGLLWDARARLAALPGTRLTAQSGRYLTAPVGGPDQDDFLNQVVELHTTLPPRELLAALQDIERELGRMRVQRWGPRTLDLDILWYHGFSASDADLEVPHPRMAERRFVLEPLAELAPDLVLPGGRTVMQALTQVRDQEVRRLPDGEPGMAGAGGDRSAGPSGAGAVVRGNAAIQRRSGTSPMDYSLMQAEIRRLAKEKGAVILAHNYQRPEVQDVADITGDSLGLSRQAAASKAKMIVFCGVHFMAETAAILAPDKPVIFPEMRAGCPMADMVDVEGLQELKAEHPGAVVVSYVNTTAAVKAISDICCTSANAAKIVQSIAPDSEIIFTPDENLGAWAAKKAGRELILWPGFCPTHEWINVSDVELARVMHPGAKVVVHPECKPEVSAIADAVESTSGMVRFCREDSAKEYLIGTELGMLYRLSKDCAGKIFYPVTEVAVCQNMKMTTIEKVLTALRTEGPVVTVDPDIRAKALTAVQRMIEVG